MPGSAIWLVFVAALLPAAWYGGLACGRVQDRLRRGCVIGFAFTMLIGWTALIRHPAVAVQIIPLNALARIEGIGAAPLFLFMLGVGWHLSILRRQRAVMIVGMLLGAAYFVQGGMWMMRPTPTNAFDRSIDDVIVMQSQDYSCVPAASATALRMLGIRTNEAEMAELTETRAGSGATLLRALNGLQERLRETDITSKLLEPDYNALTHIEPPMLTPVRYEPTRLHMVTIIEVRPDVVIVADPQVGIEYLSKTEFESIYRGQVIAFEGGDRRVTAHELLSRKYDAWIARTSEHAEY